MKKKLIISCFSNIHIIINLILFIEIYIRSTNLNTLLETNTKKSKSFFAVVSIKHIILPIIFVLFTIGLVIFSTSNLVATKRGLKLWADSVVPSLFPFFIITNLLSHTNIINYISRKFNGIMKPLFNVPGESAYAFIIGLISRLSYWSKDCY